MYTTKINEKEYNITFDNSHGISGNISGSPFEIDIIKKDENSFHILKNFKSYNVNILSVIYQEKIVNLKINEKQYTIEITDELDRLLKTMGIQNQKAEKDKNLKAPMPGLVTDIKINIGDIVKKGDNILVLEAMKMENNLKSNQDAVVKDIMIEKGTSVEKNQTLVIFE